MDTEHKIHFDSFLSSFLISEPENKTELNISIKIQVHELETSFIVTF